MIGQRFGRLTVMAIIGGKLQCLCDCGERIIRYRSRIVSGKVTSCGCYGREVRRNSRITHGRSRTPEFRIWAGIIQRCTNPNRDYFKYYGGRGINICQRWKESFAAFFDDVGLRPTPSHSIDRIDNNRGYEPGNVRWATKSEQAINQSSNRWIEYEGKRQTMTQWALDLDISLFTLRHRLNSEWPLSKALTSKHYIHGDAA